MINNRYIIKKKLGTGRSIVFLCEDLNLSGKDFAIKILSPETDEEELLAFKNEFFILQNLNHPNIVKSFDYGTVLKFNGDEEEIKFGSKYFTLELCTGKPIIDFKGIRDETKLRKVIGQICSVLFYLHQSNYTYYDLKLENLFVSEIDGEPFIQLIDLGLAKHNSGKEAEVRRGTAEYIAPEILKGIEHDYKVDFYSLGIMLYRIMFGRFPFTGSNDLEIFKSHIEKEIEISDTDYTPELIGILKKLLSKTPSERYDSAIQIIHALNIPLDEKVCKDWLPAKTFADRTDTINILNTFIKDDSSNEVFTLHGTEGAGKSAVAYKIYSIYDNAVLISNGNYLTGPEFVKNIIRNIIFNEKIFSNLTSEIIRQAEKILEGDQKDIIGEVRGLINQIASAAEFTIIFDSFNTYDDFTVEVLKNVIPVLQVNKAKVILTENSDKDHLSEFINNLRIIDLTPFTEAGLNEYLDLSLSPFFPKVELKRLILAYADLLPGSLEIFFKDLILLKFLRYSPEGIEIGKTENSEILLRSSHEEIYSLRLQKLNSVELELVQLLSSFEISMDDDVVKGLIQLSNDNLSGLYSSLAQKNILHRRRSRENPVFTSEGLKKYIYSSRRKHAKYHKEIAEKLKTEFPGFNRNELARQFELANEYEEAYIILEEEIKEAEKQSAYSYEKSIMLHLSTLPLRKDYILKTKHDLCNVYYKLGEFVQMNSLLDELLEQRLNIKIKNDLLVLKGFCLIGLGEYAKGKTYLEELLSKEIDPKYINKIKLDIATAEYNLNEYEKSKNICFEIINGNFIAIDKANAYEILGLNEIQDGYNLEKALNYFQEADVLFSKSNRKNNFAINKLNMGNIYDLLGKSNDARELLVRFIRN